MGPRFRVSSERLEKPGIEPTTPVLEGEQLNHYATEASSLGRGNESLYKWSRSHDQDGRHVHIW